MEHTGKTSQPVNPFVQRVPHFEPTVAREPGSSDGSSPDAGSTESRHEDLHGVESAVMPELPCVDQLVVITGATGQLGQQIAQAFGDLGADLMLIGRDFDELKATADGLDQPERAGILACDLVSDADVASTVEFLTATERQISILIHAAGLYAPSTVTGSPVEDLDQHYLLNLRGPYLLTQKLIPLMGPVDTSSGQATRASQVVFLLADQPLTATQRGGGFAHVQVINAAVDAFTEELRVELDPRGIDVGVITAELIHASTTDASCDETHDVTPIVEMLVDTIVHDGVGIQSLRVATPRVMRNA